MKRQSSAVLMSLADKPVAKGPASRPQPLLAKHPAASSHQVVFAPLQSRRRLGKLD